MSDENLQFTICNLQFPGRRSPSNFKSQISNHKSQISPGYTLVELLVSMGIIATLLGMSVAAVMSLQHRTGAEGVQAELINIVRQAMEAAVGERADAEVAIIVDHDRAVTLDANGQPVSTRRVPARVQIRTKAVIGEWHFEDQAVAGKTTGAFGQHGTVTGARLDPGDTDEDTASPGSGGKIGRCFCFDSRNGESYIRVSDTPRLNPGRGVRMEAWIYREGEDRIDPGEIRTILQKGEGGKRKDQMYFLELDQAGRPAAGWGGGVSISGPRPVPLYSWTHIAAEVTPGRADLLVNGVLVARTNPTEPLVFAAGDLFISHPATAFRGRIDEVRLLGIRETEWHSFGPDVHLTTDAPYMPMLDSHRRPQPTPLYLLCFDDRGSLDRAWHTGPVRIQASQPGVPGAKRAIDVAFSGQIERAGFNDALDAAVPSYLPGWERSVEGE
jgi:Tfp pilus assembly protein FimT